MRWVAPELPQGYRIVLEVDGRGLDVARQEQLRLGAGRHRLVVRVAWTPPAVTRALPNYPNPFNPETWIPFELKEASDVRIQLYDMGGNVVRRLDLGYREEGYYMTRSDAAYWDGRNESGERVASGVYFYELRAGDFRALRRLVVSK
jgi:hypothetical protein